MSDRLRVLDVVVSEDGRAGGDPRASLDTGPGELTAVLAAHDRAPLSAMRMMVVTGAGVPAFLPAVLDAAVRATHEFGSVEVLIARPAADPDGAGVDVAGRLPSRFEAAPSTAAASDLCVARGLVLRERFVACLRPPHTHDPSPQVVVPDGRTPTPATYVVPVRNEAAALPSFLGSLSSVHNVRGTAREFVFVLSDSTDASESIIRAHLDRDPGMAGRVVSCGPGIPTAFRAGVAHRGLDGYVGKVDADVRLDPHVLDALEGTLSTDPAARVAYAEPLTAEAPNPYTVPSHHPSAVSRRNYFTGKTSLHRSDPFDAPVFTGPRAHTFRTEDVPLSFDLAHRHGLESIVRAPGAVVHEKCVKTFSEFATQIWRAECEVRRVVDAFPCYEPLLETMRQTLSHPEYEALVATVMQQPQSLDEWSRLEGTK